MKYFKHTFWIAVLLVLLLPGCSNDGERLENSASDLAITLTTAGAKMATTKAISIAPLPGESLISNVYILFYEQGVTDAPPVYFHSKQDMSAENTWTFMTAQSKLEKLTDGALYDVYVLASIAQDLPMLPTASMTRTEFEALEDYRCYCGKGNEISFIGRSSYTHGTTTVLDVDLTRTVARLDIVPTAKPGNTLLHVGVGNIATLANFQKDRIDAYPTTQLTTVTQEAKTGAASYHFYLFANTPDDKVYAFAAWQNNMTGNISILESELSDLTKPAASEKGMVRNTIYQINF